MTELPALALPDLNNPEAAAALVGLAVVIFFVGLYLTIVPHIVEERLQAFVNAHRKDARPDTLVRQPPELMAAIERQLTRRRAAASTRMLIVRAGLQMTLAEFLLFRLVTGLVLGVAAAAILAIRVGAIGLAGAVIVGIVGSLLPVLFTRVRASRRVKALETQLPDALDMVAASLQAGSGLAQAFELLAREMHPPISDEFRRVLHEIGLGLSLNEALTNLSDRVGSEDVDLVATSINIQTRIGGNLVHVLRTITNTIRERIRIRGEINVLTSMQRLSAIVVSALPPGLAVVLFLLNPGYMGRLFEPGLTRCVLAVGVIMMAAGFFALRKLTDIEV